MTSRTVTLIAGPATLEAADTAGTADGPRRVRGLAVPYGRPGRTSIGVLTVDAGVLTLPDDVGRIRYLFGHDRDRPAGVAVDVHDDPAVGLALTFALSRNEWGDRLAAELDPAAPVRDGMSVELDDVETDGDHITAGRLVAVAAVPLPAYDDARATLAAGAHPAPATAPEGAPPVSDLTAAVVDEPVTTAAPTPTLEAAAEPPARSLTATPAAPARTRPVSAALLMAQRIASARLDGTAPQLLAALSDITPTGNGAGNGNAGLATQALGELWDGVGYEAKYRPLIAGGQLTGSKVTGWRWKVPPVVADYTGDKADVPSNAAKLEAYEVAPTRLAGAHDIDRIYVDLGDPAVMVSYWQKMAESLAVQLDARALALIVSAAGAAKTPAPASLMEARIRGAFLVDKVGRPSFTIADEAAVLAGALEAAVDAPVGPTGYELPPVTPSGDVTAGTVLTGARDAVRLLVLDPPIRVEAVNVAQGGVDAGLFGYSASVVENPAGVVKHTVTAPSGT